MIKKWIKEVQLIRAQRNLTKTIVNMNLSKQHGNTGNSLIYLALANKHKRRIQQLTKELNK